MLVHKKISFLFVCIVFAFASCSLDNSDSSLGSLNGGSIYMTMPAANGKASGSPLAAVSANVPSNGAVFSSFKIFVRNSSLNKELTQTAAPGAAVTFGDLEAGYWDVVVWGFGKSNSSTFYGATKNILVADGQTSTASVTIKRMLMATLYLTLGESEDLDLSNGRDCVSAVYVSYKCGALKKSDSYFAYLNLEQNPIQPESKFELMLPLYDFLLPDVVCDAKVYLFDGEGSARWRAKISTKVPSDGNIAATAEALDTFLYQYGDIDTDKFVKIDKPLKDSLGEEGLNCEFEARTIDGADTEIAYADLKMFSVVEGACGRVPVVVEYGDMAWAQDFAARYPSAVPEITIPDMSIPVGVTRTLSATLNPNAPSDWPICQPNEEVDDYGLSFFALTAETAHDVWNDLVFSQDYAPSHSVNFDSSTNKATATSTGSDSFNCQLEIDSQFGYFEGDESQHQLVNTNFTVGGSAWYVSPSSVETPNNKDFTVTIKNDAAIPADYEQCSLFNPSYEGSTLSCTEKIGASGVVLTVTPNPEWPDGFNHPVSLVFNVGDQTITESFDIKITAASGGGGGGGSSGWHFDNTIAGCTYGASAAAAYPLTRGNGTTIQGTPCVFYLYHDGYDESYYEEVESSCNSYFANLTVNQQSGIESPIKIIVDGAEVALYTSPVSVDSNMLKVTISSSGNAPQDKVTSTAKAFTIKIIIYPGTAIEDSVEQTSYFVLSS